MYGKGCPGPTASGVRTGKISRSNRLPSCASSFGSRSSMPPTAMPSASSAGRSSFFQSRDCSAVSSSTRSRIRASACCGVRPSAERTAMPDSAWPEEPGDSHLEELVEVRREDPAVVDPLEQGQRLVRRELEHARVELEVRELAVEEVSTGSVRTRVAITTFCIGSALSWGEDPVKRLEERRRGRPRRAPLARSPCFGPRVRSSAGAGRAGRPRRSPWRRRVAQSADVPGRPRATCPGRRSTTRR